MFNQQPMGYGDRAPSPDYSDDEPRTDAEPPDTLEQFNIHLLLTVQAINALQQAFAAREI